MMKPLIVRLGLLARNIKKLKYDVKSQGLAYFEQLGNLEAIKGISDQILMIVSKNEKGGGAFKF